MKKVFIDGSAGTTGLRIHERLSQREDIELITLPEEKRKELSYRSDAINLADVAFLCLPDDAAREAVGMVTGNTVIIDTSTAHRTSNGWAYGFPELSSEHREKIVSSKRIAVPGCHASGFIALIYPLISAGLLNKNALLSCFSVTGYSGGGKKMIAQYQDGNRSTLLSSPRMYALGQSHKHLREMSAVTGINNAPVFCPVAADFYSGMEVTVPLFVSQLEKNADMNTLKELYREKYSSSIVFFSDNDDGDGFKASNVYSGLDCMEIGVSGNDERLILTARYDNLGKGASGAAVQNLNLVLGVCETEGLNL